MNNNNDDTRKWADSSLAGKPIDIAPWTYEWRADRAIQEKPEAYFIPRRLDRLDNVYRTAYTALPQDQLKSIYYDMPELLKPLLPKPKGTLQAGLLWTGGLVDYQVELKWPAGVRYIPSSDAIEVRVYPTVFGWFGWTVDQALIKPHISANGRTWTYKSNVVEPGTVFENGAWTYKCGSASGMPAATEMVAVFYDKSKAKSDIQPAIPIIRVVSPSLGTWKRMDVEIEWGFQTGTAKIDFDGSIETHMAMTGPISALGVDKGTTVTGEHTWQSQTNVDTRRGIVVPVLYASKNLPGLDSRITVRTKKSGFTFRISDLENGPILIPEHGVFITKAGSGKTARQFEAELKAKNLKLITQMTREHREVASWEEMMREVRLSTCPPGTVLSPFPKVENPPMQVELSDEGWTNAWRAASFQLKGPNMWGGLAWEAAGTAHQMDLIGLHDEANKIYTHFLKSPGVKSDGDYVDANGSLEWATDMKHDMGYSHDGTHASTGRLLLAMADHYLLTGDQDWFSRNRIRMQSAADWIIRQRELYLKDIPNRQNLFVAGLMPVRMWGDYAIPSCDWRWYYLDDAFSLQGLQRFADALTKFDSDDGRNYKDETLQYSLGIRKVVDEEAEKYRTKADEYRKDIRRAVEQEAALAPVRQLRDGTYHSFVPIAAYERGLMLSLEIKAPQRPQCDVILGSLPLAEPFGAIDATDFRMVDTLNVMEETGTSAASIKQLEDARKSRGLSTDDAWFWNCFGGSIPKLSHNANIYLLQDDIPNFLRFWMNSYAPMVGADGRLWEWGRLGEYTNCTAPDNGSAGWFMENFRNLLVMEDGQSLWVAKATPRAWLEQGKKIAVKGAPTYFGDLAYEIISDVDNGKITATIEIPNRVPIKTIIVRFRHPQSAPIQSVTVNGKPWTEFNPAKETIELKGFTGKIIVVANYKEVK